MSYFVTSLNKFYHTISLPNAGSTACTDIMVTEDKTKDGKIILRSTEFNVRIPVPLSFINMYVNGKKINIKVKSDENGICFFEGEHDSFMKNDPYKNTKNKGKDRENKERGILDEIARRQRNKICRNQTPGSQIHESEMRGSAISGNIVDPSMYNELPEFQTPDFQAEFLEYNGVNTQEFEKARKDNYVLRNRYLKHSFYSTYMMNSIGEALLSVDHFGYLHSKASSLYYFLTNYRNSKNRTNITELENLNIKEFDPLKIKYKEGKKQECKLFTSVCKNFKIEYSDCFAKQGNICKVFNKNTTENFTNLSRLILRIKTCEVCCDDFYLPFALFCELDHLLFVLEYRSVKSKKTKFCEISNKKYYESMHLLKQFRPLNYFTSKSLTSEELKSLNLEFGENECVYKFEEGDKVIEVCLRIYKLPYNAKIVVSDIDGTVTKSDVWGNLYDYAGKDYTHAGIAKLYSLIEGNGYQFIYLSTRPYSHYNRTKSYVTKIEQEGYVMPKGAIFLSVSNIFNVIYTEVIKKSPHLFKISTLTNINKIIEGNGLKGGFGNKLTDTVSYKAVGIAMNRIFKVDSKGVISLCSGLEVRSGYSSLQGFVNAMFPAEREVVDLEMYKDFNYWN